MGMVALITGVTGQDGAYLAQLLLRKGYDVAGTFRRTSHDYSWRLKRLKIADKVHMVPLDLTEQGNIWTVIDAVQPDEIYNLAAQSYVAMSFTQPVYTGEVDALGVVRLLEAVRVLCPRAKFYQASTSEMYGNAKPPQSEATPFAPRSPYAAAKLMAHWSVATYRDAYNLFACSGVLFNHESPLRGLEFVTRKIVHGLVTKAFPIKLGNVNAKRDWGFAGDYVEGMWKMLQAKTPQDFVLATGQTTTVQSFGTLAANHMGIDIEWHAPNDTAAFAVDEKTGKVIFEVDPDLYRPAEVDVLCGDPRKAKELLGWEPTMTLPELVAHMVESELDGLPS